MPPTGRRMNPAPNAPSEAIRLPNSGFMKPPAPVGKIARIVGHQNRSRAERMRGDQMIEVAGLDAPQLCNDLAIGLGGVRIERQYRNVLQQNAMAFAPQGGRRQPRVEPTLQLGQAK